MLLLSKDWLAKLHRFVKRPWYLPAVFVIAAINAFLPFVPVEVFLIARVLLHSRHWFAAVVLVAAGTATGALALAVTIGSGEHSWFSAWVTQQMQGSQWDYAASQIRLHGAWGIGVIAASFVPEQPAIVIGALAKMPLSHIVLPIFVARTLKYGVFAAIAVYAPHWILSKPTTDELK